MALAVLGRALRNLRDLHRARVRLVQPIKQDEESMSQHTVASYDTELKALTAMVSDMGAQVLRQLDDAIRTMSERNTEQAQRVIATDRSIDMLQQQIEERAIMTIAKRQPVASDLRDIISTLKVANDLERIGDLSKNIAKRVLATQGQAQPPSIAGGLEHMGERVREQVAAVMAAYKARNDEDALEVWRTDSEIDALNTSLFRELLTYMMEDPRNIGFCTHLLFCSKNLERAGDHATNIAETIHYMVTGELIAIERPKGDLSSEGPTGPAIKNA
jgi:phosphate transport system protein